jgi:bifunctional DNase/RNase
MEEMPGGRRREIVMVAPIDTAMVPMRVGKAVALGDGGGPSGRAQRERFFMVLDEADGSRHLVIGVGEAEAFALDCGLQGLWWGRPMTYEFTAALVRGLGGRVREVRLDRVVDGAYAATVEVEGPQGVVLADARCSDALNLAVLTQAPVLVAPQVLDDCTGRQDGDSAEAALLRRAVAAGPMAIGRAGR